MTQTRSTRPLSGTGNSSSAEIAVLIPSLRPHLWDAIRENVEATSDAKVYFLGSDFRSYAKAINAGWRLATEPYLFTGADDLTFHKGWAKAALRKMKGKVRVVGTNDLHNPYVLGGLHSTHSLVDRRYIEEVGAVIDEGPGSFLFDYGHNYVDVELVETARHRGVFAPCLKAIVEHRHPDFANRKPDKVHLRTRRSQARDFQTFQKRRKLWTDKEEWSEYMVPENA